MSSTGIEALGNQAIEPFGGQLARLKVVEQFREIIEEKMAMSARRPLDAEVLHMAAAPAAEGAVAVATPPVTSISTSASHAENGSSLLVDPALPSLELLPSDLVAGDLQYNEREVVLRERLDLSALEDRLRASAAEAGSEFHSSDLEGVLRNAGYDGAHLGSSERYMAAIERFVGEAENTYRQRSSNIPGSNA